MTRWNKNTQIMISQISQYEKNIADILRQFLILIYKTKANYLKKKEKAKYC